MKRRKFVTSSLLGASALSASFASVNRGTQAGPNEVYELREYDMQWRQEATLENYFKNALIPALNKYGSKNVGVFSEIGRPEPPKIYLLISYPSPEDYFTIPTQIAADSEYQAASKEYRSIPVDKKVYYRYSSKLMLGFDGWPKLKVPPKGNKVYELRTYEGYSEDAVTRKVKMFNDVEIDAFAETNITPVFLGKVIAGIDLPCLTYIISFKDMEERDKNWSAFIDGPPWARISVIPEYANSVSKVVKRFLEPMSSSQV